MVPPDVSRRIARIMNNLSTPMDRQALSRATEAADSWENLPQWAKDMVLEAERKN